MVCDYSNSATLKYRINIKGLGDYKKLTMEGVAVTKGVYGGYNGHWGRGKISGKRYSNTTYVACGVNIQAFKGKVEELALVWNIVLPFTGNE